MGDIHESSVEGCLELTLGRGTSTLNLISHGPVSLLERSTDQGFGDFDFDLDFDPGEHIGCLGEEIVEQVSEQLNAQMEIIEDQLDIHTANLATIVDIIGLSPEQAEQITQRTRQKVARAQVKIRRSKERAARKISQTQRRAVHKPHRPAGRAYRHHGQKRSWSFEWSGARAPKPNTYPVADGERMMVLDMLAQNKISIEGADSLLEALEGRSKKRMAT